MRLGTDFYFFVTVQNVKLCQSNFIRALTAYSVARRNNVKRSYPSGSARRRPVFAAELSQLFSLFTVPYTSSSSTIAAYAPIGAGVPNLKLDNSIGIMKAYSSCVGAGPFTCEYFGDALGQIAMPTLDFFKYGFAVVQHVCERKLVYFFAVQKIMGTDFYFFVTVQNVKLKNMTIKAYGFEPVTVEQMKEYFETYGKPLAEYVTDVGLYFAGVILIPPSLSLCISLQRCLMSITIPGPIMFTTSSRRFL